MCLCLSDPRIELHDDAAAKLKQRMELLAVEFAVGILQTDYRILSVLDKAKRTDWYLEGTDRISLQNATRKELYSHKTGFMPPQLCRGPREI